MERAALGEPQDFLASHAWLNPLQRPLAQAWGTSQIGLVSPRPRPLPRTQACQGPKFWGRLWVGGNPSATTLAGSYSSLGLCLLWPLFPNFHFAILTPSKSPRYSQFCSSLSRLYPAFSAFPPPHCLDQSADASSPLPARTLCHILSRTLSSPLLSVVSTAHLSWPPIPGSMPFPPTPPSPHC